MKENGLFPIRFTLDKNLDKVCMSTIKLSKGANVNNPVGFVLLGITRNSTFRACIMQLYTPLQICLLNVNSLDPVPLPM